MPPTHTRTHRLEEAASKKASARAPSPEGGSDKSSCRDPPPPKSLPLFPRLCTALPHPQSKSQLWLDRKVPSPPGCAASLCPGHRCPGTSRCRTGRCWAWVALWAAEGDPPRRPRSPGTAAGGRPASSRRQQLCGHGAHPQLHAQGATSGHEAAAPLLRGALAMPLAWGRAPPARWAAATRTASGAENGTVDSRQGKARQSQAGKLLGRKFYPACPAPSDKSSRPGPPPSH